MLQTGHLRVIFVFGITFLVSINCTNRVRHRHRKQAIDGSSRFDYDPNARVTLFPNVNVNPNPNQGTPVPNVPPPIPWPGSDNSFPFVSQWGAWTQQQMQQGSGQRYVDSEGKIQIYPSQAQWYPNSPEYQGIRPAPPSTGQRIAPGGIGQQQQLGQQWQTGQQQTGQQWQTGQQQTGQQWQTGQQQQNGGQNYVNPLTGAIGNPDGLNIQQWQVEQSRFPQDPALQNKPPVIYWPPPNTTVAPGQGPNGVTPWSTWTDIKQQGISGGILSQWQNWYQNPDVWAQWQEWMVLQQRKGGEYANGPDGRAINFNVSLPDDTSHILVDILAGFVGGTYPRRVAMYNAKTYYPQYRRDYWVGMRYYPLDPQSVIDSYFTCTYPLPSDINVLYEVDNTRIKELVFQCVKLQETCCNLNCCDMKGQPLYYSGWLGNGGNLLYSSSYYLLCISLIYFLSKMYKEL